MSAFETIGLIGRLQERTTSRIADVPRQEPTSASVVLAVVSEYPHPLHWVTKLETGVAFKAKTLLALVTYCYLNRVYNSEEIENAMRRDKVFRFLCANEFPTWHQVANSAATTGDRSRIASKRRFVEPNRRSWNRPSAEGCRPPARARTNCSKKPKSAWKPPSSWTPSPWKSNRALCSAIGSSDFQAALRVGGGR